VVRGGPGDPAVRDALRLALGTLTILPVRPPEGVDPRTGGRAMVLAPLVGLLLGAVVAALLWTVDVVSAEQSPLVAAVLGVAAVAALTRGIHLDGLADTADGLGSNRPADAALAIMRKSDVGPFGVATLVLTLLLQVAALSVSISRGTGPAALVVALVVSRLTLPLACSRGVPAARSDGLGAGVAGTVPRTGLLAAAVIAAAVMVLVRVAAGPELSPGGTALWLFLGGVLPLLLAAALCRRCVRRLGGVTGDVLGACVEVAFTASLLLGTFG
jgi:adenosylcobinamide-GDP ribazoletransferase